MNVALLVLALTAQQPQDTVVLKPIVVTATRVPVAADLVASAVTVLRGADLVAQGIRTVADALESVPGAHIVETGSFGGQTSLFMRGGESDYTKVLLDGVPLNEAGGFIDLAHLTTDNVDRIEVVRGPVSVLYGTDAVTGVVQVFTRTGRGNPRMGAEQRGGTYGATAVALDIDRKSTRLNSSHSQISYAVFCLKKKKRTIRRQVWYTKITLKMILSFEFMIQHSCYANRTVVLPVHITSICDLYTGVGRAIVRVI